MLKAFLPSLLFMLWNNWLLTLKAPPIICSRWQFQILTPFRKKQIRHDISWELSAGRRFSWNIIPYYFGKLGKMSQNLSSAAVVVCALRVNRLTEDCPVIGFWCIFSHWWFFPFNPLSTGNPYRVTFANSEDPDEMQHFIRVCTVC